MTEIKFRVIAKDDYVMYPHTWTKGLDYELVDRGHYVTIASDQGQVNYTLKHRNELYALFNHEEAEIK